MASVYFFHSGYTDVDIDKIFKCINNHRNRQQISRVISSGVWKKQQLMIQKCVAHNTKLLSDMRVEQRINWTTCPLEREAENTTLTPKQKIRFIWRVATDQLLRIFDSPAVKRSAEQRRLGNIFKNIQDAKIMSVNGNKRRSRVNRQNPRDRATM